MAKVLIVDDEPAVRFALREILAEREHEVLEAGGGVAASSMLDAGALSDVDLVLTDFAMPELDGLALLSRIRARHPELPVVLLTARGSERLAARAIKEGAFDYVPKPFELDELEGVIARAIEIAMLRRESSASAEAGRALVGRSPALRAVVEQALRVARRDVAVLVRGDTGTGKELLAALLHAASPRAKGPFVRFNCGAIPAELAESELFGHARGAFTGAAAAHRGYFARADDGTLVLDEIGELPLRLQPILLRALSSGEIQPVGGAIERVDVRIVACTNRDLRAEVTAGRFREDLYYRLAVVELQMPTLAERPDDIPLLARFFARAAAERFGLEGVTLTGRLVAALERRSYPGNVRELENLVTRLVALSEGGAIDEPALGAKARVSTGGSFREQVEALERSLLEGALARAANNQSEAARTLGLSRATFIDKLKRYGLA